ncbi:MAG: ABC transporter permease [Sandaracinaceae bacterium]
MSRWLAMLSAVVRKEVRQTTRDKRMMALLVLAPLIQLFVFGHAVNLEVDDVPTVVVDRDGTETSRAHLRRLLADGTLTRVGTETSAQEAERWLEEGRAAVVLVVPEGLEADLARGRPARVQAILDGSDPNRAGVAASAVSGYFTRESEGRIRAQLRRLNMRRPDVRVASRVLFNPELDTAIYMVPGVAAMLLLLITTIVTAMGLSRERELGTLEQILVTPVPSGLLILGKIIPFAVIGVVDFGVALVVGAYVFDMPLGGDFVVLFGATLLYLTVTLGMGLLISTLSGSQQQAFMGGFLFMLPAALLSGIMTPIRSMPEWLQPFTLANPLRHYAEVLRGVLLRGAGFEELSFQLVVLAAMGAFVFGFAAIRFRKSVG